ncbi:MAG TPA: hypothetical protein VGG50_05265 [Streptosporangiaceae bacterium]|jgi:hypothetical protein
MAGASGHTRTISGNEYLYGAVHGRAAIAPTVTLPTQLRGLVRARGAGTALYVQITPLTIVVRGHH